MNMLLRSLCLVALIATLALMTGCHTLSTHTQARWHPDYDRTVDVAPIEFHYDHGVLAGSYPGKTETLPITFDDVCAQLGHVCLCGAGGFRIAERAVSTLQQDGPPLERGDFILISGRDHTVSDVIAFVLGCTRRADPERNQYFIDDSLTAPRREYHYYMGDTLTKKAVHILYRKHLLIGHEKMDRLWKIELGYEEHPETISQDEIALYRTTMRGMVNDVLFNRVKGLITVEPIPYEEFEARLQKIKGS